MIKKKINSNDNLIDLTTVIEILWRQKFFILFITLICSLLFCSYILISPKKSKSEIFINFPSNYLLNSFCNIHDLDCKKINDQLIIDTNVELLSSVNFKNFVKKIIKEKKNNLYISDHDNSFKNEFFENKIQNLLIENKSLRSKSIDNQYLFTYPIHFNGELFLNNYLRFIEKKLSKELYLRLSILIDNQISMYKKNLEIAKLLNLEYPISITGDNVVIINQKIYKSDDFFYQGTKVLEYQINNLKLLKDEISAKISKNLIDFKILTLPYNLNLYLYMTIGLVIGFILALIIIFFREILNKNNFRT